MATRRELQTAIRRFCSRYALLMAAPDITRQIGPPDSGVSVRFPFLDADFIEVGHAWCSLSRLSYSSYALYAEVLGKDVSTAIRSEVMDLEYPAEARALGRAQQMLIDLLINDELPK